MNDNEPTKLTDEDYSEEYLAKAAEMTAIAEKTMVFLHGLVKDDEDPGGFAACVVMQILAGVMMADPRLTQMVVGQLIDIMEHVKNHHMQQLQTEGSA